MADRERPRSPVGETWCGYLAFALDRLERRFGIVSELACDSGLSQIRTCTSTGRRAKLEQSEMVRILRLQRAHQNLKFC
jgi:hypothetical protein